MDNSVKHFACMQLVGAGQAATQNTNYLISLSVCVCVSVSVC